MESNQKSQNKIQVPIVAILGHVNHGKTSILDYIRKTSVQLGEAGGITQKISVFTINPSGDGQHFITFVDTPGHEAFDLMRLRGGKVADIVLLIVAANDGVQPQTIESIEIINSSNVKPIVVINKIDLPGADIPKIKRDLATRGLLVEGMGGNIPVVEVSAKTGKGITELMDMISLLVDVEGLKPAEKLSTGVTGKGFILESVKDKSMGFVASVIVTEGVFEKGCWFAYRMGTTVLCEKLKGFITEEGKNVEKFDKGFGGKIIGLSHLVDLGAEVYLLKDKDMKLAEKLLKVESKPEEVKSEASGEMSEFFADFFAESDKKSEEKVFKIIIKSSSEGSLEAIKKSISKIPVEGVKIEVAKEGIGDISISDIETALVTKSLVLGFEVSYEKGALDLASKNKVFTKTYDIIYRLVEEVAEAISMLLDPGEVEEEMGSAEIKAIFTLSDGSKVIGCRGIEGTVKRGEKCYIVRKDDIVAEGKILSMKHSKSDIKEAGKGDEFGVIMNSSAIDISEGDTLYCFKIVK